MSKNCNALTEMLALGLMLLSPVLVVFVLCSGQLHAGEAPTEPNSVKSLETNVEQWLKETGWRVERMDPDGAEFVFGAAKDKILVLVFKFADPEPLKVATSYFTPVETRKTVESFSKLEQMVLARDLRSFVYGSNGTDVFIEDPPIGRILLWQNIEVDSVSSEIFAAKLSELLESLAYVPTVLSFWLKLPARAKGV